MLCSHLKILFIIIAIFSVSVVFCSADLTVHAQSDLQTTKYRNMVIDLGNGLKTNALLRDFRRWLINERVEQRLLSKEKRRKVGPDEKHQYNKNTTILWIEKLLQTPIDDYRKFAVWRILAPYLINIKKYSDEDAFDTIKNWLNRCNSTRQLDFNPNYVVKYNVNSAKRAGYRPISLEKLKIEYKSLHSIVA
jgi:Primase X